MFGCAGPVRRNQALRGRVGYRRYNTTASILNAALGESQLASAKSGVSSRAQRENLRTGNSDRQWKTREYLHSSTALICGLSSWWKLCCETRSFIAAPVRVAYCNAAIPMRRGFPFFFELPLRLPEQESKESPVVSPISQTRARYHANKRLHGGRTGVPLSYGAAQIFRVPDGRSSHQAGSGRSKNKTKSAQFLVPIVRNTHKRLVARERLPKDGEPIDKLASRRRQR